MLENDCLSHLTDLIFIFSSAQFTESMNIVKCERNTHKVIKVRFDAHCSAMQRIRCTNSYILFSSSSQFNLISIYWVTVCLLPELHAQSVRSSEARPLMLTSRAGPSTPNTATRGINKNQLQNEMNLCHSVRTIEHNAVCIATICQLPVATCTLQINSSHNEILSLIKFSIFPQ